MNYIQALRTVFSGEIFWTRLGAQGNLNYKEYLDQLIDYHLLNKDSVSW
jgi:hypothetical protein